MLPKLSGYEICRKVRAEGITTPILMLTARGEEAWLSEIARNAAPDAGEREIAHCTRVREGGAAPEAAGEAHARRDSADAGAPLRCL